MKMLLVVLLVVLGSNRLPGENDGRRRAKLVTHQGQRGRPPRNRGQGPPEGP